MPFAYYNRLSSARKRTYRQSDSIVVLTLPRGIHANDLVVGLRAALVGANRRETERASQRLLDALVAGYAVPPLRARVLAQRPADGDGELHGLYEPEVKPLPRITVWMRTAARRDVVAFKTFLRTLIHELCHHLDYELFKLPETFHTEGFYKRESSLVHELLREESRQAAVSGDLW
jgi:hypothetical protein